MSHTPPTCSLDVACDFFHDTEDLLQRYKLTIEHFYAVRSKRLKCFVDLRMAAECMLKAHAAYYLMQDLDREQVIKKVEKIGHRVKHMGDAVEQFIDAAKWDALRPFIEQLEHLPVGLRYRLDVFDFRDENEERYYQTVGSDQWLDDLHDAIAAVAEDFNEQLATHDRILTGEEVWQALEASEGQYNKYAKKP